jgi:hypothetical protein
MLLKNWGGSGENSLKIQYLGENSTKEGILWRFL